MSGTERRRHRLLKPAELENILLHSDGEILAFDKPPDIPCHPSKAGAWSSLAGAVREHFRLPAAHLVFRLDRETSGVVVFARSRETAKRLQGAMESRLSVKAYLAVMAGEFKGPLKADAPLGPDTGGPVAARTMVRPDGRPAVTRFFPLASGGGFTLARAVTETGRKHQIRAHALWLGHPLAGDKIYGPDPRLFLEFLETGWTPALEERLLLPRQALHCAEVDLRAAGLDRVLRAPLPADLREFCLARGIKKGGMEFHTAK